MKANRRPLAAVGRRSMTWTSAACVFARRLSCVSANEESRKGVADRPGGTLRGLRFRRRPMVRPRASVRTKQDRKKHPRRRSCSRGIVEIGGPASPGGWPPSQFGGVRGSRKVQESPPAALSAVAWRMTRSVSPGPSTTRRRAPQREHGGRVDWLSPLNAPPRWIPVDVRYGNRLVTGLIRSKRPHGVETGWRQAISERP